MEEWHPVSESVTATKKSAPAAEATMGLTARGYPATHAVCYFPSGCQLEPFKSSFSETKGQ